MKMQIFITLKDRSSFHKYLRVKKSRGLKSRGFLMMRPETWGRCGREVSQKVLGDIFWFFHHLVHIQGYIYRDEKGFRWKENQITTHCLFLQIHIVCSTSESTHLSLWKKMHYWWDRLRISATVSLRCFLLSFQMVLAIHIWPCQQLREVLTCLFPELCWSSNNHG